MRSLHLENGHFQPSNMFDVIKKKIIMKMIWYIFDQQNSLEINFIQCKIDEKISSFHQYPINILNKLGLLTPQYLLNVSLLA